MMKYFLYYNKFVINDQEDKPQDSSNVTHK